MSNISIWNTTGIVSRLKDLADRRKSASQIAAILECEFSVTVSRNAVISKCQREEIRLNGTWRAGVRKALRCRTQRRTAPKPKARVYPLASMPYGPPVRPLTFLEVGTGQCRFPIDDSTGADMRVCGEKTHKAGDRHLPYCKQHASEAYLPEKKKRRKADRADPVYKPQTPMAFDYRSGRI